MKRFFYSLPPIPVLRRGSETNVPISHHCSHRCVWATFCLLFWQHWFAVWPRTARPRGDGCFNYGFLKPPWLGKTVPRATCAACATSLKERVSTLVACPAGSRSIASPNESSFTQEEFDGAVCTRILGLPVALRPTLAQTRVQVLDSNRFHLALRQVCRIAPHGAVQELAVRRELPTAMFSAGSATWIDATKCRLVLVLLLL